MAGDDVGEMIGCALMVVIIVIGVTLAVIACMTVGVVYGAGRSLWNYGLAFHRNVRPERVTV